MNASMARSDARQPQAALTALLLVLATETVFFGTLLMAYLYLRTAGDWPGVARTWSRMAVPVANLGVLLGSEALAWRALLAGREGRYGDLRWDLGLTLALGALFVAGQVYDFTYSGMSLSGDIFGGVFFALMGFHALHVVAGLLIQSLVAARAWLGDFERGARQVALRMGFWFWTYVVAVWVVLFTALYLI